MSATDAAIPTIPRRFRLAIALDRAGVTKDEMARHLDVDPTTVGKWLRGQRNPNRRTLMLWAMRCGVPFEWLSGDDQEPTTPPAAGRRESGHTQEIIASRCTELSAA